MLNGPNAFAFGLLFFNQQSAIENQHLQYSLFMISGRRRQVIFFTVFGICLVAIAVTLNISWVVLKLNADF